MSHAHFFIEGESDRFPEIQVFSQNGIGKIEPDIIGLEFGRKFQTDSPLLQRRGKSPVIPYD